jgi:hypothetical protein
MPRELERTFAAGLAALARHGLHIRLSPAELLQNAEPG